MFRLQNVDSILNERSLIFQVTISIVVLFVRLSASAESADYDTQLWFPAQIVHQFDERWSTSMQWENRWQDEVSALSETVYKPGLHYHIDPHLVFSGGYKYIDKQDRPDEQDPWQEITLNSKIDDLVMGHQFRLEERLIDDIDGLIPRVRYLLHLSHPLGDSPNYVTSSGEIRFNLTDKHKGPVSGFEQSRLYAGLGRHIGKRTQLEIGYLWRYEEQRSTASESDHAIRFLLIINTQDKLLQKPTARDLYR